MPLTATVSVEARRPLIGFFRFKSVVWMDNIHQLLLIPTRVLFSTNGSNGTAAWGMVSRAWKVLGPLLHFTGEIREAAANAFGSSSAPC